MRPPALRWPSFDFSWKPQAGVARARDLRLDFLRGFCVFAMLVDHFGGSSWLYALTGGNQFFVSAAEGFVFLSGLVLGLVYRGEIERKGMWSATKKALRRAFTLYSVTVGLTLSFVAVSHLFGMPWDEHFKVADPLAFVWSVATLRQTYALVDVMLLYTLLVAAAPLTLWLLRARQARMVLLASWSVWLAYQLAPGPMSTLPWAVANNDVFHFMAWQALFITAVVMGYHRQAIATRLGWLASWTSLVVLAPPTLALVWLYREGASVLAPLGGQALLHQLSDKAALAPLRVLTSAVVFVLAFGLVSRLWQPLQRSLGWLLVPLGQCSLYAYIMHLFLIVLVSHALGYVQGYDPDIVPLNTMLQALTAVGLWLMVRRRFLFALLPR